MLCACSVFAIAFSTSEADRVSICRQAYRKRETLVWI